MPQPNIVLFMTDQQRADQLGFASDGYYRTPNLDALAGRGVVFDNAYSGSTVCVPARTSLLTGLLPHRAPTQHEGMSLREGHWTIARALRAAGYDTALIGKMHLYPIHSQHGFSTMQTCEHLQSYAWSDNRAEMDDYHAWLLWQGRADARATYMFGPGLQTEARAFKTAGKAVVFPYEERFHPTGWIRDRTLDYLRKRPRDRPFLLIVSFPHPHTPYDPPEPYASMYAPEDSRLPQQGDKALSPFVERALSIGRFGARRVADTEPATVERTHRHIRALISQIDTAIGAIVDKLDLDDSLLFFTSDHGDYGGHRGLLGKVPWVPFDDLARVPLICAGAGVEGARHCTTPVQSFDWVATALAAAGVDAPVSGALDAVDLGAVLRGEAGMPGRPIYCGSTVRMPMVRADDHKYIRNEDNGDELLFDLAADPHELRNLAADPRSASRLSELRAQLDRKLSEPPPSLPTNLGDHQ